MLYVYQYLSVNCISIKIVMFAQGDTSENLETMCDKKQGPMIMLDKFCKKCACNIGDFKIMKHVKYHHI